MGKKKQPTYRVVAAESRRARSGAFLEILGTYQPRGLSAAEPETVTLIDNDKVVRWLQQGAQPTERVAKLPQDQWGPGPVRGGQSRKGRPVSDVNDYVAGDVNTIDDRYDDEDVNEDVNEGSDPVENAATATAVLQFIATSLAEDASAVSVDVSERQGKVVLSLSVGANDMGRIIGRRGRTAQAIRALVGAAGARDGVTTSVDIVD